MTKFSSKILDKIKQEKVTPRPRWYFILIHTLLGTAILCSIIIGGIAVAIFIRHLALTDWEIARQYAGGHMQSLILVIPYIWLIFIGFTLLLADSLYKHTKKGHRLRLWQLIGLSIGLSVIFGCLFYFTKADQPIEFSLSQNVPGYAEWKIRRDQVFVAPEKGIIAGEIVEIDENGKITVVDFKKQKWIIDKSEIKTANDNEPLEIGERVGVIGKWILERPEVIDETTGFRYFKAIKINPWQRDGRPPVRPDAPVKPDPFKRLDPSMQQKLDNQKFFERKF